MTRIMTLLFEKFSHGLPLACPYGRMMELALYLRVVIISLKHLSLFFCSDTFSLFVLPVEESG